MPSKPSTVTLAPLGAGPIEKFNAAEQGGAVHDHKRGHRGRNRNRAKPDTKKVPEIAPGMPTPQRLAKGDAITKTPAGHYRAPPPIERLRTRTAPDGFPVIDEPAYQAALKLETLWTDCGLSGGVQAQDLNRIVSGGGDVPHGMALSEHAAHVRQEFRLALKLMGWHEAYPFRGNGRLVVDVVCHGMAVQDAARIHIGSARTDTLMGAGIDRLREGLFILSLHWKMRHHSA